MVVIFVRWLYAPSPTSFSKPQIILLLFFKFLIPSKEIARFHKKKARNSKQKKQKKNLFFLCCANRETWQSFLPLSVKQGKLVNFSSPRGSLVIFFTGIMGICIVLVKKNNTSPGCINCLHERHLLQPKNIQFSSQCMDEIPLGFWFIQGYFFFNRQSRVLLWRKNKSAAGFRLCTTAELTRLAQPMSLTKTGRTNGRHPGVSPKRQKRTEVPSIAA